MDKYEYRIRAEEINTLIEKKQFNEAVKIADTIDWSRVKSVMMLCKVSELYKYVRRFDDAKEILLLAYDRQPGGRKIVYSLCELAIKLEETVQAVEYYKEFVQVAPTDTRRFILQYRLYEAQDVSLEERIAVLEEYKKRDYREKWAYELAYLYHRIGLATRCVEECDELILWFGEGKYVTMAMELKMLHAPLTPAQQEKYEQRFMKSELVEEETISEDKEELPIEIKAVDATKAKTTEIIPNEVIDALRTEDTHEESDADAHMQSEQPVLSEQEMSHQEEVAEKTKELPLIEPDMDIQVKTVDVGEYNTINLQQELAQNLSRMFAQEDMEAADATMALPIETIIDTAAGIETITGNDKVMESIKDDVIKDALLAPLLQDTTELRPIAEEDKLITEEDLLASMEQERLEVEKKEAERKEAERLEAERKEAERQEAERLEAERKEAERLAAEKLEAERKEAERLAAEKLEAERLEAERLEAEKLEAERKEAERLAAEKLEAERLEAERLAAEKLEAERLEAERLAAEKLEAERKEAERLAAEKLEAERKEAERLAAEKLEAERKEAERLAAEKLEAERKEAERLAAEKLEAERLEAERLAAEKLEAERKEAERLAAEKLEAERLEAERLAAEKLEAERKEAERLAAEKLEAERLEAERLAAEKLEAERLEAERKEAERLEAERKEAEKLEAEHLNTSVTAGAIMAAEIAHAVTTGNTGSLNIGQTTYESAKGSLEDVADLQKKMIDEQISGQLNLLDIMSEWEETKKANEEKRIAQMREKVLKQTGPMFSNFDAVARASVSANLDLINPAVDVFANPTHEKVESEVKVASGKKAVEDAQEKTETIKQEQAILKTGKSLNTEEINGLEEKLLEVLAKTEAEDKEEPVPNFVPDFNFEAKANTEQVIQEPIKPRMIISEEAVTPVENLLAVSMKQNQKEESAEAEITTAVQTVAEAQNVVGAQTVAEAQTVAGVQTVAEAQAVAEAQTVAEAQAVAGVQTVAEAQAVAEAQTVAGVQTVAEAQTVAGAQTESEEDSYQAIQEILGGQEPVASKPHFGRAMTKEEKDLFGVIAPSKDIQDKVVYALDLVSLHPASGNALVIGENGTGRGEFAKNIVKHLQAKNPNFSGAIAKISGELLATKDIGATLRSLENGALIVENAGGLEMDILGTLLYQLEREPLKGIFVVLEDTKEEIDKLIHTYPHIEEIFDAKITIDVLDNDGLVNFAKTYANSREYSIDELGVLAIYTRISDLQTIEHAVTVSEVKDMVDEAIVNASKKNVKHFMDVIIGKRYDDDDMIILHEKDFSKE